MAVLTPAPVRDSLFGTNDSVVKSTAWISWFTALKVALDGTSLHVPATVSGPPLTISGQDITMNYDSTTLGVSGNDLYVKNDGHTHATQYLELDGGNAAATITINDLVCDDITINTPSSVYSLSHNSFANYVANEHINWTNASDNLVTSGYIKSSASYLDFSTGIKYGGNDFLTVTASSVYMGSGVGNSRDKNYSIAIGTNVLYSQTSTASTNWAIGYDTFYALTTGVQNFGIGTECGRILTTGSYNMFGGHRCAYFTNGNYNLIYGYNTGFYLDGSNNVVFGPNAGKGSGPGSFTVNGVVWIGNDCAKTNLHTSNTLQISNTDTATPLVYGEFDNYLMKFNVDTLTISAATTDTDITLNFIATTNSGVLEWMEDEDHFRFSDDVKLADGENLVLGQSTGSMIGTNVAEKIGFWAATPVVQPAAANQAALTNSTGGSYDGTLAAVSGSGDDANINNNFTDIYTLLAEIRTALVNTGLIKGAA